MPRDVDRTRETPGAVVGAVALGTAPVPFLGVYAIMFIVHGGFHHVIPPDITSSARGELWAGIITLALFVVALVVLFWMYNGTRRWPFALAQLAVLGTAIDFLLDETKGGPAVSVVLAGSSAVALVLAFAPASWRHMGHAAPHRPAKRVPVPETV
jgi:hypothetical protein